MKLLPESEVLLDKSTYNWPAILLDIVSLAIDTAIPMAFYDVASCLSLIKACTPQHASNQQPTGLTTM